MKILKILLIPTLIVISLILGSCISKAPEGNKAKTAKKPLKLEIPVLEQTPLKQLDLSKNPNYTRFAKYAEAGPVIPGLMEGSVPQGLAYLKEKGWLLISSYMNRALPSNITAVDLKDGKLKKTIWLAEEGGVPFTGHVGGICVSKKHIWVASGNGLHGILIENFLKAKDNSTLIFSTDFPTEVRASFATSTDGYVWVGEFSYYPDGIASRYSTKKLHHLKAPDGKNQYGWAVGYKLDEETDMPVSAQPQYVLSIMDKVQGMAFYRDYIFLSTSYGRSNNSRLLVHKNPMIALKDKPHTYVELGGKKVPLWFIYSGNQANVLVTPSMMEGITMAEGKLALLFESGADKYRSTGIWPLDKMYLLDIERFLKE